MSYVKHILISIVLVCLVALPASAASISFEGTLSSASSVQEDTLDLAGRGYRITADVPIGASGTGIPLSNGEFQIIGGASDGTYAISAGELGITVGAAASVAFSFDATGLRATEGHLPHGRAFELVYLYTPANVWGGGDAVTDLFGVNFTAPLIALGKADVAHVGSQMIPDQYGLGVSSASVVPEPTSIAMLLLGALVWMGVARRR